MNDNPIVQLAVAEIVRREPFHEKPYFERGMWIMGYACRALPGGMLVVESIPAITEPNAREWLTTSMRGIVARVMLMVNEPITDAQIVALSCLAWDIGTERLRGSDLMMSLNRGDFVDAAARFGVYVHHGNRLVPEWREHRAAERTMFLGEVAA